MLASTQSFITEMDLMYLKFSSSSPSWGPLHGQVGLCSCWEDQRWDTRAWMHPERPRLEIRQQTAWPITFLAHLSLVLPSAPSPSPHALPPRCSVSVNRVRRSSLGGPFSERFRVLLFDSKLVTVGLVASDWVSNKFIPFEKLLVQRPSEQHITEQFILRCNLHILKYANYYSWLRAL